MRWGGYFDDMRLIVLIGWAGIFLWQGCRLFLMHKVFIVIHLSDTQRSFLLTCRGRPPMFAYSYFGLFPFGWVVAALSFCNSVSRLVVRTPF